MGLGRILTRPEVKVSISLRKPILASGEIESECQGVPRAVKSDSGKVVVDADVVQSLDRHVLNIGEAVRSGPSPPFSRAERGLAEETQEELRAKRKYIPRRDTPNLSASS